MDQVGRSVTQETWGYVHPFRYALHDRETKFCASFRSALASGGVKTFLVPAKSPNLNVFAERCVRSVKQECLSKLILSVRVRGRGRSPSTAATLTMKETSGESQSATLP